MKKVYDAANLYVAFLRALYLVEQNSHWLTRGVSFYGDHILFERLYQASAEGADLSAEKMIGLFGEEGLDVSNQANCIAKLLSKYQDENLHELCLKMERDFLLLSESVYNLFEKEGVLSLGTDDLIMAIASKHEEALYLLQQSLDGKEND